MWSSLLALLFGGGLRTVAQDTGQASEKPATLNPLHMASRYQNLLRGINFGATVLGVHDSALGWSNVVTPGLTYTFSPRYSADASVSIYPYRLAENQDPVAGMIGGLFFDGGDVGDTLLEAHAIFARDKFRSLATGAVTLPSGDRSAGLGTGRVTFNVDNRFERYFGQTGLIVDLGGGDSSGLTNRLITQDDNALGPVAQFQAGIVTWLPRSISFQSVAYEQLPIGDQKTYATVSGPGGPPQTVVTGRRVNEDNGFTGWLCIPLSPRVALVSSYNRSLRLHLDTVSVGFSFAWKGQPIRRAESLIDRAMREAEFGKPIPLPADQSK